MLLIILSAILVLLFIAAHRPWAVATAVAIVALGAPFFLDVGLAPSLLLWLIPLFLLPWWLGPFVIWVIHRFPSSVAFEPYHAQHHDLPDSLLREHAKLLHGLTDQGFQTVGDLFQVGGGSANLSLRIVLMRDNEEQLALVAAQVHSHGSQSIEDASVEFVTKSSDGRVLLVNNARAPSLRVDPPNRTTWSCDEVRDPSVIVAVNRAVRDRWLSSARADRLDAETSPREFLRQAMIRALDELVDAGLYKLDDTRKTYRPTLVGAFRITWTQLPPTRWIRRAAMRRKTRRLLDELGFREAIAATKRPRKFDVAWAPPIIALAVVGYLLVTAPPQALDPNELAASEGIPTTVDVPADFDSALDVMAELSQSARVPFMEWRDWVDVPRTDGAVYYVSENRATALVHVLQPAFLARGFSVVRVERNFGYSPDAIAVLPFNDPFQILAAVQTDGTNYDVSTDSIIAWMRHLSTTIPFRLTEAGLDYFEVQFLSDVTTADALARQVYAFCPDVVDQGVGTVDALAESLRMTNTLYCWWD